VWQRLIARKHHLKRILAQKKALGEKLKNLVLLCFGRKEKNRLRGFINNIAQK
jgi:hypothetical protein